MFISNDKLNYKLHPYCITILKMRNILCTNIKYLGCIKWEKKVNSSVNYIFKINENANIYLLYSKITGSLH